MAAMAFGFGLEGCCDRDSTHRCSAEENRVSALLQVQQWERRKLKLPVNRVSEQEELGLCLAKVSSLHRAKWEKGPGEAGALVLSWMVNEAAEKGGQISWLCMLKAQIKKRIALLGGFSHPILWGFVWSNHKRQHLNKLVGRPQRVPPKDCLLCSPGIQDGQASRAVVLLCFLLYMCCLHSMCHSGDCAQR